MDETFDDFLQTCAGLSAEGAGDLVEEAVRLQSESDDIDPEDVFAGENCTTPALTILSITLSETDDDAAPTITWVPLARCRSTVVFAVSVVVSPESPGNSSTG